MAEQNPKLGKIGGVDTKQCAVTGKEATNGMMRFSLGNGWYFRVIPSRISHVDEAFIEKMKALIPVSKSENVTTKKVES